MQSNSIPVLSIAQNTDCTPTAAEKNPKCWNCMATTSCKNCIIGMGTIFRLGEQKLNDLSVREANIGQTQSRQSNSKYNFMQYVFLEKRYMQCTMGSGAKPQKLENFCVKSNLSVCKVIFSCKLQKNWGSRMY